MRSESSLIDNIIFWSDHCHSAPSLVSRCSRPQAGVGGGGDDGDDDDDMC